MSNSPPYTVHPEKFECFLRNVHAGDITKWKQSFVCEPPLQFKNQHGLILLTIEWKTHSYSNPYLRVLMQHPLTKTIFVDQKCKTTEDLILLWRNAHACQNCAHAYTTNTNESICCKCQMVETLKSEGAIVQNMWECEICKQTINTRPVAIDKVHYGCYDCALKVFNQEDAKCPLCQARIEFWRSYTWENDKTDKEEHY